MTNILLIGSGGREHAIFNELAKSEDVNLIFASPGNPCMLSSNKAKLIKIDLKKHEDVVRSCVENEISLVVIGPEQPLSEGLADSLIQNGIKVFGPTSASARIECSKSWSKDFMVRNHIPTAQFKTFDDLDELDLFLNSCPWKSFAVKISGLAGGKGVLVTQSPTEAREFLEKLRKSNPKAAESFIVEEGLEGTEVSVLAFTDGTNVAIMPPAQDHKRRFEFGKGPNTGGMGALCPSPMVDVEMMKTIKEEAIVRAIDGLRDEGYPFVGVLYAGLMLTSDGPKVLEYNCRFGDPETQAILPLLKTDLFKIMKGCVNGCLNEVEVEFAQDVYSVAVCVVIDSYPGDVKLGFGKKITGLDEIVEKDKGLRIYQAGTTSGSDKECNLPLTAGGRVLAICCQDHSLYSAAERVFIAADKVKFDDASEGYAASFRRDIAFESILRKLWSSRGKLTYKNSGVDVDKGDRFVEEIKHATSLSFRPGVRNQLGLFGSIFDLKLEGYPGSPLLIAGTDGVGTKLEIAQDTNRHCTIGQDLVAMSVNDILMHAAEPMFFLDYFSTGKLEMKVAKDVVIGVAKACAEARCSLVGGETAEMAGFYPPGRYDLGGFAVGVVEEKNLLPKFDKMEVGDVLIGIRSSGLHSNGFSLVRKLLQKMQLKYEDKAPFDETKTLADSLLQPTYLYTPLLRLLRDENTVGAAHITGGGIGGNLSRVLPTSLSAQINTLGEVPSIFIWMSANGICPAEMWKTFNLGIGVILIVKEKSRHDAIKYLDDYYKKGESLVIGKLVSRTASMNAVNFPQLEASFIDQVTRFKLNNPNAIVRRRRRRVAVLISGSGTNLQALLDHTQSGLSSAEIVLVISNVDGVKGLERAREAGVSTKVIPHKNFSNRALFEAAINKALRSASVEIVCLAGFMRIVTADFVNQWNGRLINIHPSLLPSFKGMNAQQQALEAGVFITGCSVHFVRTEVDSGAKITQEAVPILQGDNVEILSERIKAAEHVAYPRALELLASGEIILDENNKCIQTAGQHLPG